MMQIVEHYRQRKYCEDIEMIKAELQGTEGLLKGLDSDQEKGIS